MPFTPARLPFFKKKKVPWVKKSILVNKTSGAQTQLGMTILHIGPPECARCHADYSSRADSKPGENRMPGP